MAMGYLEIIPIVILEVALYVWLFHRWRKNHLKNLAYRRLFDQGTNGEPGKVSHIQKLFKNQLWIPLFIGLMVFSALFHGIGIGIFFCLVFSILAGVIGLIVQSTVLDKRMTLFEEQLTDAIDLMISSLGGGSSANGAMEAALDEMRPPLRPIFRDMVYRLRLGDRPQNVFEELADRIPLETFKIFSLSMSVHWGTGGQLIPLLKTVSKTIRDRFEISRQTRLQSAQSRFSALAMVGVTYLLAWLLWRSNPANFVSFLMSSFGYNATAIAILLQGLGILWISKLAKVDF